MYTLDSVRLYPAPYFFIRIFWTIHICLLYIRAIYVSESIYILYILITIYVSKIQNHILIFHLAVTHIQPPYIQ